MTEEITIGEVRTKVYPIPGSPDGAIGEYRNEAELRLLDEFQESGYLEDYHQAVLTGDRDLFDRLIAAGAVYVAERFGRGQRQRKADVLGTFGAKEVVNVKAHKRHDVKLIPFGDDTIVMTGISTSEFTWQGKQSNGPRIFAQSYKKIDGQFQCFIHSIMDYDGWL
jgi:hypothetical protein